MKSNASAIRHLDGTVRANPARSDLTGHPRADAVFAVLAEHLRDGGCPTLDEIGVEASIRSRQVLVEALDLLESHALIRRIPNRHRNIRLTEQGRTAALAVAS